MTKKILFVIGGLGLLIIIGSIIFGINKWKRSRVADKAGLAVLQTIDSYWTHPIVNKEPKAHYVPTDSSLVTEIKCLNPGMSVAIQAFGSEEVQTLTYEGNPIRLIGVAGFYATLISGADTEKMHQEDIISNNNRLSISVFSKGPGFWKSIGNWFKRTWNNVLKWALLWIGTAAFGLLVLYSIFWLVKKLFAFLYSWWNYRAIMDFISKIIPLAWKVFLVILALVSIAVISIALYLLIKELPNNEQIQKILIWIGVVFIGLLVLCATIYAIVWFWKKFVRLVENAWKPSIAFFENLLQLVKKMWPVITRVGAIIAGIIIFIIGALAIIKNII